MTLLPYTRNHYAWHTCLRGMPVRRYLRSMETTESTESAVAEVSVPPSTAYVKVKWVAGYFAVGLSTIYDAIEAGDLPAIRVGRGASRGGIRVRLADVQAYEKRRQIHPAVLTA